MADVPVPHDLRELIIDEAKAAQMVLSCGATRAAGVIVFVVDRDLVLSGKFMSPDWDIGAVRAIIEYLDEYRAELAALLHERRDG